MAVQHLEIHSRIGLTRVVDYLENLIEALKQDGVRIAQNGKSVILRPRWPMNMELKIIGLADARNNRQKIGIKFKWEVKNVSRRHAADFMIVRVPALSLDMAGKASLPESDGLATPEKTMVPTADGESLNESEETVCHAISLSGEWPRPGEAVTSPNKKKRSDRTPRRGLPKLTKRKKAATKSRS